MNDSSRLAVWISNLIGPNAAYKDNGELAHAVHVSEGTIRNLLLGREPSLKTLRKLSEYLGVSLIDLQKMAGVYIEGDNHVPRSLKTLPMELEAVVGDLESLQGTPMYIPTLKAVQVVIDIAKYKLDLPE